MGINIQLPLTSTLHPYPTNPLVPYSPDLLRLNIQHPNRIIAQHNTPPLLIKIKTEE